MKTLSKILLETKGSSVPKSLSSNKKFQKLSPSQKKAVLAIHNKFNTDSDNFLDDDVIQSIAKKHGIKISDLEDVVNSLMECFELDEGDTNYGNIQTTDLRDISNQYPEDQYAQIGGEGNPLSKKYTEFSDDNTEDPTVVPTEEEIYRDVMNKVMKSGPVVNESQRVKDLAKRTAQATKDYSKTALRKGIVG